MCVNSANKNYRNKCLQYAQKIKNITTKLALEHDWLESGYMGKN
jgi:hypothetical protein